MFDFFKKLSDEIKKHDRIILMTHSTPDLDGLGSVIVFSELLKKENKECYIVAPKNLINKSLNKAIKYLQENDYVLPFKYEKAIDGDLLVIFDVNSSNFVECTSLLNNINDKIIIDHHFKGINTINDCICDYIEEDRSSTVEIVTEYLKYENVKLNSEFYTILFAGLYVDTDAFNFKTTAKTFEIASYLLENGADIKKKQEFLKESIDSVMSRYKYLKNNILLLDDIYLCIVDDRACSNITVAKIADQMLNFEGVGVSLAVGASENGDVYVSARSIGYKDVSKFMRKLGGGGRFSSAAAVIHNNNIEDVVEKLKLIVRGK